jgi:hypothetical protein
MAVRHERAGYREREPKYGRGWPVTVDTGLQS